MEFEIFADGGTALGVGYCSFDIIRVDQLGKLPDGDQVVTSIRKHLLKETMTSNTAEYLAQMIAVQNLRQNLIVFNSRLIEHSVILHSDSRLVVNQLTRQWKVNYPHLLELRDRLRWMLVPFREWGIEWIPRERMVERFGH